MEAAEQVKNVYMDELPQIVALLKVSQEFGVFIGGGWATDSG